MGKDRRKHRSKSDSNDSDNYSKRDRRRSRSRENDKNRSKDKERKRDERGRDYDRSKEKESDRHRHGDRHRDERRGGDRSHRRPRSSDSSSGDRHNSRRKETKHKDKRRSSSGSSEDVQRKSDTKSFDDRQKQNVLLKATETPEEKRARRLAKKDIKEKARRTKMGWDKDELGYTNEDNPFGDHNLSEAFVWKKKLDTEGKGHLSYDQIQEMQRRKMEESKKELEGVRKRRLEREKDREDKDKLMEMEQRDKESEYYHKWEQQEDKFHLDQAKLRSRIRIADGRAKPIDLLSKYISDQDPDDQKGEDQSVVEMHEPTQFLVGLTRDDLEDLLEDIKVVYMELEQGRNAEYWRDITTVVEDELNKLKELDVEKGRGRTRDSNISEPVLKDIAGILRGKTYVQLKQLETQVTLKLSSSNEGLDVTYWETILERARAQMARTRLRERHQESLRRKLEQLKQEQGVIAEPLFPSVSGTTNQFEASCSLKADLDEDESEEEEEALPSGSGADAVPADPADDFAVPAAPVDDFAVPAAPVDDATKPVAPGTRGDGDEVEVREAYDSGRYSPVLLRPQDLGLDAVVYEAVEDRQKLEFQRDQVLKTGRVRTDAEEEMIRRAREGMDDEEAQFSVQVPIEEQSFLWSDKYRPRKPRFFNRVHTGFEWNKYNQTHYDLDNPPPKIVQGYKFNIFYPDLIDKTNTPTYTLTPCLEQDDPSNPNSGQVSKDFALLRFKAGPPYEDIAFKIVNREWECSYKRGFRCQFQNNIFQLWFHFKRFRYRR